MGEPPADPRPLWVRFIAWWPLSLLYLQMDALALLARYVLRVRVAVVRDNLAKCFPERSKREISRLVTAHYRQIGQMVAETFKAASMTAAEITARVAIRNIELPRSLLAKGRPVLLLAAHQANWEWVLHALALQLGYPFDVAYKPIRSKWLERGMRAIRERFGAHLIPARKELLMQVLQRRHIVRGIAMLADQSPVSSEHMHWVKFLGRDTAFYMGAEKMALGTRYDTLFVELRRLRRGWYEIVFQPLALGSERPEPGEITTRYAKLVEAEILAAPADWTWGHRRWNPKKGIYGVETASHSG